ncbi:hypothetical protein [Enterococcus phage vB_EfaM_Ef2.3]|uniref:Uncharacterized protein n=1 Tax=Enterococcus phage vB_EfaM_Ef2.3 TaxID=2546634 RepID=A0A4D6DV07_9CAUD|nr:hypothetical protein [Enterococcus phage vB_EfaM_Ef2.3]QBZ70221.1 hypothetical protein [Enterococcus phage vB_EfaM_Ef2.3]
MQNDIYYTIQDRDGFAESYNESGFLHELGNMKIIDYTYIALEGAEKGDTVELVKVPILEGYQYPYDFLVIDEIGKEHYIYYEEEE